MARARKQVNQKKVTQRRLKQGRGQGRGKDYMPWLRVQDGPSQGFLVRDLGWKTGRTHHFMSKHEDRYFCLLEWAPNVVDIREQYPLLPLERTLEIADRLRIKHPAHPRSKQPIVMTTDFLVDVKTDEGIINWARTVKPSEQLASKRVIEKFEIERTYWAEQGVDWGIITEREIGKWGALAKNVQTIHRAWNVDDLPLQAVEHLHKIEELLFEKLSTNKIPPSRAAGMVDDQLGLKPGCALVALKHFVARKMWRVDMAKDLDFNKAMLVRRPQKGGAK